jgi:hypothetical protein
MSKNQYAKKLLIFNINCLTPEEIEIVEGKR